MPLATTYKASQPERFYIKSVVHAERHIEMLILRQVGYTTILLLVEVIIADITSLKTRLVFSYVPTLPFIINTWISGNVSEAVLSATTWRWGIGMWGIVFTGMIVTTPVFLAGIYDQKLTFPKERRSR